MVAVLLALGAMGWWWWQGGRTPLPRDIDFRSPIVFRGEDSMSTAPSPALARAEWHPVAVGSADPIGRDADPTQASSNGRAPASSNAAAAGSNASVQHKLRQLSLPNGPAMVTFAPGEATGFLTDAVVRQLPRSARGISVAVVDSVLYVRAEVLLREIGMEQVLGELAGLLDRRDTVIVGSTFSLSRPGYGQMNVREIIVGNIALPRPLVSRLVASDRRRRGSEPRIADDAYPVRLPAYVGDIRIRQSRITLYRSEDPFTKDTPQ
jgi:hypothetical protein